MVGVARTAHISPTARFYTVVRTPRVPLAQGNQGQEPRDFQPHSFRQTEAKEAAPPCSPKTKAVNPPRQERMSREDSGALTSLKKEDNFLSALLEPACPAGVICHLPEGDLECSGRLACHTQNWRSSSSVGLMG